MNMSRSTVVRELTKIRDESIKWLKDIAENGGHVMEVKKTIDRSQDVYYHLVKLREGAITTNEKIQIEKAIVEVNHKLHDLFIRFPLVLSFEKHVGKKLTDVIKKERKMAVFPDDLKKEI